MTPEDTGVLWLKDVPETAIARFGRKATALGKLVRAGFPVPPGFALDADTASSLREADRRRISEYMDTLDAPRCAVRSSAPDEDGDLQSLAGQEKTLLNVPPGAALWRAIQRVGRGRSPTVSGPIPVVIQAMCPAVFAGVVFTANPQGEPEELLVEATWGLGEALVAGKITPDAYVLDRTTGRCLRQALAPRTEELAPENTDTLRDACTEKPVLDPARLRALWQLCRRIEDVCGAPQDIEWAWADGFAVLQTRPLTVLVARHWQEDVVRHAAGSGSTEDVWVAMGPAELLPCPTPLSFDVVSRFMSGECGYGKALRNVGFDPAPGPVLERLGGHVYVNLRRESRLYFHRVPLGVSLDQIIERPLRALTPRLTLQWRALRPRHVFDLPRAAFQVVRLFRRLRLAARTLERSFATEVSERHLAWVQSTLARDLSDLTPTALVAEFDTRLGHWLQTSTPELMTASIVAAWAHRSLEDLLIRQVGAEGIDLARELLCGLRPNPLLEFQADLLEAAVGALEVRDVVQRFGHRSEGPELELLAPRFADDLPGLERRVQEALAHPGEGKDPEVSQRAQARLEHLAPRLSGAERRLLDRALARARALFPLREQAKDVLLREFALLRTPLLALDRLWALEGGVFYLTLDDLHAALAGGPDRSLIAARRKIHAQQRKHLPPAIIIARALLERSSSDARRLGGLGVSRGLASGPARLVTSAEDLQHVGRGDIVVLVALVPTWIMALSRAGGFVAERGGSLSHGAIVARELDRPAVVNVPGITAAARNGTPLAIDGGRGEVTIGSDVDPSVSAFSE